MKTFNKSDIFINRIKTYPKTSIMVHSGNVYYNNKLNTTSSVMFGDLIAELPQAAASLTPTAADYIWDASNLSQITTPEGTVSSFWDDANVSEMDTAINVYPTHATDALVFASVGQQGIRSSGTKPNYTTNFSGYNRYHMFVVINPSAVNAGVGVTFYADKIVSDNLGGGGDGAYFTIGLTEDGIGAYRVIHHTYGSGHDVAYLPLASLNVPIVIEAKKNESGIAIALNGGAFSAYTPSVGPGLTDMGFSFGSAIVYGNYFKGKFHEFRVHANTSITDEERTATLDYLVDKWSITV